MKKISLFFILFFCFHPQAIEKSSLLLNVNTGVYEHSLNPDTPHSPASLTKMMTLYLVFDALKEGRLTLGQRIIVPKHATTVEPSKMGLVCGEEVTVEDLILGMVVKSANDAAVTIAHHLGPTEKNFTESMNAKATVLGLQKTRFCNAAGFYHKKQRTTARDMATLGLALYKHHQSFYHYFSRPHFQYKDCVYPSTNAFLHTSSQVDGIKTGYIKHARHNFVVSAIKNGERFIAVVLGAHSRKERNDKIALLLQHRIPPSKVHIRYGHKKESKHIRWSVQVGAFKAWKSADKHVKELRAAFETDNKNLDRYIIFKENKKFKSRFGPYRTGEEALQVCQMFKKHGVDCLVVTH